MKNFLVQFLFLFLIIFSFINLPSVSFSQKQALDLSVINKAESEIEALSNKGSGLIDCNTSLNTRPCTVKDTFTLLGKLGKFILYIIIISLSIGGICIGAMYPFYGDNPEWLKKNRERLKNLAIAMLLTVSATGFVFAILATLGANKNILDLIKWLIAAKPPSISYFLIERSYAAQDGNLLKVIHENLNSSDGQYLNVFDTASPVILINKVVSFLVKFIAIPMLILALIWTGFLFVKAQGNSTEIDKAKKWAFRSVIGILIAAAAPFISNIFFESLKFIFDK